MIDWLKEYDYAMVLVGAFLLAWLYWFPRIVAPFLIPRYNGLPPVLKAAVNLVLPTIEKIMLESWDMFYTEVVREITDTTETELDDKVWREIDEHIRERLKQDDLDYYPTKNGEHM